MHGTWWMLALSAHLEQLLFNSLLDTVQHQRGIYYLKIIRNFWLLTISLFYFFFGLYDLDFSFFTYWLLWRLFFSFDVNVWLGDLFNFCAWLWPIYILTVSLLSFDFWTCDFFFLIFLQVNHMAYHLLITDEQKPGRGSLWLLQQFCLVQSLHLCLSLFSWATCGMTYLYPLKCKLMLIIASLYTII